MGVRMGLAIEFCLLKETPAGDMSSALVKRGGASG